MQIKSKKIMWAGRVERMRDETKVCKVSVGKHKGNRPLGRPRRGWEVGIRIDLRELGCRLDPLGSR